MKKIFILFVLILSVLVSKAQVYQEMPQYGYRANRMAFDTTLQIPTVCGVPTLRSTVGVTKKAAIAYDSCNGRFYSYNPKTQVWSQVTGGGGTTPNLQQVTDVGDTTTNSIIIDGGDLNMDGGNIVLRADLGSIISWTDNINAISLQPKLPISNGIITLPDTTGTLALSVNNNFADSTGNITIPTIDTSNKWVNNITRTAGKDSIIYYIGSTRYAIKDSVGTNPVPVGYYGAFSDTLNQPITSTTTAYPIFFRVTDLSNGVSIPDGKKIVFANAGVYNLQYSAQFTNSLTSTEIGVSIWIRKNGVDVPGSTGYIQLPKKGSGLNGETLPSWNFVLSLAAGDSIVWYWRADDTHAQITSFSAGTSPTRPATASTVLTVTQQSGIMAGTGITGIGTSGNAQTGATQTLATGTSGTDFAISSSGDVHTFNLPTASATNRGALSFANWTTFNNKIGASDTASMLSPYLRSNIASVTYLAKSDSSTYYTKYRSDTSRTNIYSAINNKFTTPTGWTDYLSSSTIVGTTSNTGVINYIVMGKLLFLQFDIQGTSSAATTYSFTIPYTTINAKQFTFGTGINNSTVYVSLGIYIAENSNVVRFSNNSAGYNPLSPWLTTGTRRATGFIILNIN